MHKRRTFHFSHIVASGKFVEDATIETDHGKISAVSDRTTADLDLSGYTAIPSFIDIHTHGFLGVDTASLTGDSMEKWKTTLPKTGTLKFVPTLVSTSRANTQAFLREVSASMNVPPLNGVFADVFGARLEGPFINPTKKGAHDEEFLIKPSIPNFNSLTGFGASTVKIIDIAPELEGSIDLIEYLVSRKITVSIGHSNADSGTARNAISNGASLATHLFNAMRKIHHRDPGIAVEAMINDAVSAEIINDPNHLSPEIINLAIRSKGDDRIVGITDSISATMMPDGEYNLGSLTVNLSRGKCTVTGTDTIAGSVLTMDEAFRNFISQGYSIEQAVKFLSTNPARIMGLDNEGSIDVGKIANIAVMDNRHMIYGIIKDGEFHANKEEGI